MFESDDGDHFDSNRQEENVEEIDFYDVLKVSRDASTEEIHKSFKQQCLIFHPDKQMNLSDVEREKANKTFAMLQRAHKILVDPCMRRIYDVMGIRGTNLEGWQLVDHSSTAENIRKEYEFLCRLRDNEIMLQMVNPESNLSAKFSLIGCFQKVDRYGPEFIGMTMGQNVDFFLVGSHKMGIGGTTQFNEKGIGNGTVQFWHKWAYSLSTQQQTTVFLSPDMIQLSSSFTFVNIAPGSFLNQYSIVIEPVLRYSVSNSSLLPSMTAKMIAPLTPGWKGIFALNFPHNASISLLNFTTRNRLQFFINYHLSAVGFPSIRFVYHKYHTDCQWTVQTHLSMREITPSVSYDRRLSKHLRVAFKVKLNYPSFLLQSSLKISTNLSTFEFFFVLCDNQEDVFQAFIKGIVLPLVAFNTVQFIYRRLRKAMVKTE